MLLICRDALPAGEERSRGNFAGFLTISTEHGGQLSQFSPNSLKRARPKPCLLTTELRTGDNQVANSEEHGFVCGSAAGRRISDYRYLLRWVGAGKWAIFH